MGVARSIDPAAFPDGDPNSPYRERPPAENLRLFERMKRGLCAENECTLRLKMDNTSKNYNMFDQVRTEPTPNRSPPQPRRPPRSTKQRRDSGGRRARAQS